MSRWAWCLVQPDNTLAKGWNQVGSNWYYFFSNGEMAVSQWIRIDDLWYYVDETGKMLTSWQTIEGKTYYLTEASNGHKGSAYVKGIYNINGEDYLFDETGALISDDLVSIQGIDFIKGWEKFYSNKYDDGTGTITQGYGATGKEIENWGDSITEEQATEEFKNKLNSDYAKPIKNNLVALDVILKQNEFDSLCSLAYNIGVSGLIDSTLYKYIIRGGTDSSKIIQYFLMWNKYLNENTGEIEVSKGLTLRRQAEANMYVNNIYDSSH